MDVKHKKKTLKQLFKESKVATVSLIIIFIVSSVALFPSYQHDIVSYQEGMIWSEPDLIAPFTFPIYKPSSSYEEEKKKAVDNIRPIFYLGKADFNISEFNIFFENLYTILGKVIRKKLSLGDLKKFGFTSELEQNLLIEDYTNYLKYRGRHISFLKLFQKNLPFLIQSVLSNGIINIRKNSLKNNEILVKKKDGEEVLTLSVIKDSSEAISIIKNAITSQLSSFSKGKIGSIVNMGTSISSRFIYSTLIYNAKETEAYKNYAYENVPIAEGIVHQNEKIISKGQIVTPEISRKLGSFLKAKIEENFLQSEFKIHIGRFILVLCIFLVFAFYLTLYYDLFRDNLKLLFILMCLLTPMALAWATTYIWMVPPYLIPIGLFSLLLTLVFDVKVGFLGTLVIALLTGLIRGNDFSFSIAMIVAGCSTVLVVRHLRTRFQFLVATLATFLGSIAIIVGFSLSKLMNTDYVTSNVTYAFIGALGNFLAFPLLVIIEKTFNIITDFTLIELSDINHPLLRNLARHAIGTYHHSLQVGLLSEEVASKIGANSLLCKIGSHFHDIGKTESPEYFVENQTHSNPHQYIAPLESSKAIISHVTKGLELARKYKIPEPIANFINEHHGTMIVESFYENAQKETPAEQLDIKEFQYPGIKPRTKETAIVMIADGVEAAARSLTIINDQTASKIVDNVIQQRLRQDQFSNCNITFSELSEIKKSFIKSIVSFQHRRIKYPKQII